MDLILLQLSLDSMLLLLLVFLLLTPIISFQYFIYPFIVSKSTFTYIYTITADLHVAQVSRLILNLLEANCPLDESIDSRTLETLRFCHTGSTVDTEADISRGGRGATSFGEEIHEEARWWIGDLVLFVSVDDVGCILQNNYCYVCPFSAAWVTRLRLRLFPLKMRNLAFGKVPQTTKAILVGDCHWHRAGDPPSNRAIFPNTLCTDGLSLGKVVPFDSGATVSWETSWNLL